MTYEQAHNILHDMAPDDPLKPPPPPLTAGAPVDPSLIIPLKEDLTILQRLTRKLRKDRETIGGAVDLSGGELGTELKFALDENGKPTKVTQKKELEIHHTIAEMMILANQYVAMKIYNAFPESALLRIHRRVAEDRFDELESALRAGGIEFDGSSNMALAQSLNKAKKEGKDNQVVNSLWQSLATRCVAVHAGYFVTFCP
jgi:exoribonuclease R